MYMSDEAPGATPMQANIGDSVRGTRRANGKRAIARSSVALSGQHSELRGQLEEIVAVQFPGKLAASGAHNQRSLPAHASAGSDTQTRCLVAGKSNRDGGPALLGRIHERHVLDRLLESVRAGQGRVLVLRGESGFGKSALLEYLTGRASETARGCRLVRVAGVQCEMGLVFAGLHQLCAPMLDRLEHLPLPQREALQTAFGLANGLPPDSFLVGLAVLSLLSEVAQERPLICLVDDEQWLDHASAQALGFVARRLGADPIGLVFATRVPGKELVGLPELTVAGLPQADAGVLLESALAGPLDARVRDLIVAETGGNPLALLELPRGLSPSELAGGFGLPLAAPLPSRIEDSFARQLDALPDQTRRLLLVAAADPSGDPVLVRRAADRLAIPAQAEGPAVEAGLLEFRAHVWFRHPLVRSAAYRSASPQDRQEVHQALAEVTDPQTDPDRRAWHRAKAAAGPDEQVAAELESSADQAQARSGLAAAAAFLERAVLLTADPARRTERALAAAQASVQAGAFGKALELLGRAEAGPTDELQAARADLLRGQITFAYGLGSDAPPLLLKAAKRLELLNLELARETYLTAWMAALFAGRLAGAGDLLEVSRAARALPASADPPRPVDLVLDGLALLVTDGPAAAAPTLRHAVSAFTGAAVTPEQRLRWGWFALAAASALWDDAAWHATLAQQVRLAREAGALEQLPVVLGALGTVAVWSGDFAEAAALIVQADAVCQVTGSRAAPFAAMMLASLRGDQGEADPLIKATIAQAAAGGQGIAVAYAHWVAAILANSLGRYEEALAAARQASADTFTVYISTWGLPELVEAAARTGNTEMATDALDRLAETTQPCGTDFGLGIEARCRALLSGGAAADELYREAIERLSRTRLRPELARARLLYGEWLRRQSRRVDARAQLRMAYDMFTAIGMEAFAERARRELIATGETVRKRSVETRSQLTLQEEQIARLARDGRTSPEIGTQLFLSARTVEWHLGKIFTKLGIGSRRELHEALVGPGRQDRPA
jgi:DNA-binding CsgD family transcriptional regulator